MTCLSCHLGAYKSSASSLVINHWQRSTTLEHIAALTPSRPKLSMRLGQKLVDEENKNVERRIEHGEEKEHRRNQSEAKARGEREIGC